MNQNLDLDDIKTLNEILNCLDEELNNETESKLKSLSRDIHRMKKMLSDKKDKMENTKKYSVTVLVRENGKIINEYSEDTILQVAAESVYSSAVAQFEVDGTSMDKSLFNNYDKDGNPFYDENKQGG